MSDLLASILIPPPKFTGERRMVFNGDPIPPDPFEHLPPDQARKARQRAYRTEWMRKKRARQRGELA